MITPKPAEDMISGFGIGLCITAIALAAMWLPFVVGIVSFVLLVMFCYSTESVRVLGGVDHLYQVENMSGDLSGLKYSEVLTGFYKIRLPDDETAALIDRLFTAAAHHKRRLANCEAIRATTFHTQSFLRALRTLKSFSS